MQQAHLAVTRLSSSGPIGVIGRRQEGPARLISKDPSDLDGKAHVAVDANGHELTDPQAFGQVEPDPAI